jgi:hypothetical protein
MPPVFIYRTGDYYEHVDSEPPELKALVQQTLGTHVRRIGRFIQLALIGAGRCAEASIPQNTAVFLSSGRGDLEVTIDVLEQLFLHAQAPKPLSFINTVSNAACYYIAQQLKLQSRSSFVCSRHFAFEGALQLALADFEHGIIDSALVGAVDVVVPPTTRHRQQLELEPDTSIGEASHWLWLGSDAIKQEPLAEIVSADHYPDRDALTQALKSKGFPTHTLIARGQFLPEQTFSSLQQELGVERFDYLQGRSYYDSQSGAAISAFLSRAEKGQCLLHVNADPSGRYSSFVVKASFRSNASTSSA